MKRKYYVLDVFTDIALQGNPLAVVTEPDGLDGAGMQAIAREFNLSETVFILPAEDPRHKAKVRIFTPLAELAFAGHPTVGSAVLLALLDGGALPEAFGVEEGIGVVSCISEARGDGRGYARFRLPKLPRTLGPGMAAEFAAEVISLDPKDIGFGRHMPSWRAVGPDYELIPVADLGALARAAPGPRFEALLRGRAHPAVYAYTWTSSGLQARMFAPSLGVTEDPATGSAVACLAGALAEHESLGDGRSEFIIAQGVEMGRPSRIELELTLESGALTGAEIGGAAVIVAEGYLHA